jgi:hypothetical protein
MKHVLIAVILSLIFKTSHSQIYFVILPWEIEAEIGKKIVPEHGFLPGKKFQFYPTIDKYDFGGLKMRVELYDQRDSLKIIKIDCSETEINNKSEFVGEPGAIKAKEYFQTLCPASGIILDSIASDTLKVYLQALDSRLLGFGNITAHGLCQMKMSYKNISRSYCIDITDKSPHSPIGKNAFVTRKTGTRVILSASIREAIELFFADLKAGKFN